MVTAARRARVCSTQHYKWLATDPTYAERFEDAREAAIQHLEELLMKKAESGDLGAIIFALKAARPEKYRENYKMELTGRNGGPIQSQVADVTPVTMLSDEELERIIMASLPDDQPPTDPALPAVAPGQLRIAGPSTD